VNHHSSNITILLLPAVTNCETDSKTTRQRHQKSQNQIHPDTFHRKVAETLQTLSSTNTINQWHPIQPTDLGPTHIGINQLPGPERGGLHEAYLLLTDKL
jgi:hypothetical protein